MTHNSHEFDCGCDGPPIVVPGPPLRNRLAHAFAHTIADREAAFFSKRRSVQDAYFWRAVAHEDFISVCR